MNYMNENTNINSSTSFAAKLSKMLLKKEDTGKEEMASPRPEKESIAPVQDMPGMTNR